jgi:precorrin-3B methylase
VADKKGRIDEALDIIAHYRSANTPIGIVKATMREGDFIVTCDLASMPFDDIDVLTTVIIGNSKTVLWKNRIITPRGYEQ